MRINKNIIISAILILSLITVIAVAQENNQECLEWKESVSGSIDIPIYDRYGNSNYENAQSLCNNNIDCKLTEYGNNTWIVEYKCLNPVYQQSTSTTTSIETNISANSTITTSIIESTSTSSTTSTIETTSSTIEELNNTTTSTSIIDNNSLSTTILTNATASNITSNSTS